MQSTSQLNIRAFSSHVKEFNLKIKISPEPVAPLAMAALGSEVGVGGPGGQCQMSVSGFTNLSNDCQMVCPLLFRSRKLFKIAHRLSEEAQFFQGAILN